MAIQQTFVGSTTKPLFIGGASIANQTSDASRSITLTSHQAGDMLIAMTGNRTTTAPALLTDFTDILSVNNSSTARSIRLQYRIAQSSSETISWTGAYGFIIAIRNASAIKQSNSFNSGSGTTLTIPTLNDLDASGKSYILAGSYLTGTYTGVSSPFTLLSDGTRNVGAFIENNSNSSLSGLTMTVSSSSAVVTFIVEVL